MRRPRYTYDKLQPVIEEMYFAGVPHELIAELLGLSRIVLEKRLFDWGLTWEKKERQKDYLASLDLPFADSSKRGIYKELRPLIEPLYIEHGISIELIAERLGLRKGSLTARSKDWGMGVRRKGYVEKRAYEIFARWKQERKAA